MGEEAKEDLLDYESSGEVELAARSPRPVDVAVGVDGKVLDHSQISLTSSSA